MKLYFPINWTYDKKFLKWYYYNNDKEVIEVNQTSRIKYYALPVEGIDYFEKMKNKFVKHFNIIDSNTGIKFFNCPSGMAPHKDTPYNITCSVVFPIITDNPIEFYDEDKKTKIGEYMLLGPTLINTNINHGIGPNEHNTRLILKFSFRTVSFEEVYEKIYSRKQ
jgi:hypothetical protein